MHRTLYVLVYPSRPFAAHWSFLLKNPNHSGQESDVGDRIHVTGDRLNGFQYECVRNYNVREDSRKSIAFPIGLVPTTYLIKETGQGNDVSNDALENCADTGVLTAFERACQEVPAPGPSLNKVSTGDVNGAAGAVPRKPEVKDCQWWVKQAVVHLVEAHMLLPLDEGPEIESPGVKVESLPRH